jgi:hypothetical protein
MGVAQSERGPECSVTAVRIIPTLIAVLTPFACGGTARLPVSAGIGPRPGLPPPEKSMIPVVNVVNARGWGPNATPVVAPRATVAALARDLYVAERGMDQEQGRAAVWEIDFATRQHRIFASGLRNPVGMAWQPTNGALWAWPKRRRPPCRFPFSHSMFVGQHGSWNRKPRSSYKVIFALLLPTTSATVVWRVSASVSSGRPARRSSTSIGRSGTASHFGKGAQDQLALSAVCVGAAA